jgi:hypothetical protein
MKKNNICRNPQFIILVICVVGIVILVNCVLVPWADMIHGRIELEPFLYKFLKVSLMGILFGGMLGCFMNIFYYLEKDK